MIQFRNFKLFCLSFTDVATEKTQKSLFDGIEKFDATQLKHTETQEKNPLPDKDGNNTEHFQFYFMSHVPNNIYVLHYRAALSADYFACTGNDLWIR